MGISNNCKNQEFCEGVSGPLHPKNGAIIGPGGPEQGLPPGGIPVPGQPQGCGIKPPTDMRCRDWQFANPGNGIDDNSDAIDNSNDSDFIEDKLEEAINIGGAIFNVYKLLGIHEQGQLVDCTGRGESISNGDLPNFPSENAFDKYITEWRSIQRGKDVIPSAYIGYDFGNIKTNDRSRAMYGIETNIFKEISSISIKQSSNPLRRATRARLERSNDGSKWYGVSLINLPDDDCLNTILVGGRQSLPSRYWRIRPIFFNGTNSNEFWGVQAIELFNYTATTLDNIQDKVFLENRDRDYNDDVIVLKAYYDLTDISTELSRFGIELPSQTIYATVGFKSSVAALGRPVVIGDIVELPSEKQYTAKMEIVRKWLEVTDVTWSTEGYTPGWRPTLLRVTLQPAFASQETQDIFGDLAEKQIDDLGLIEGEDGSNKQYQDFFNVSQQAQVEAKDGVPEKGREASSAIREWTQDEIDEASSKGIHTLRKTGLNPDELYGEDAIPSNNSPYTEGDAYPDTPKDKDYHRLTYNHINSDIPARLYRYSTSKGRWIYLETDRRSQYNPTKPVLQEFIKTPYAKNNYEISQDRETISHPKCDDADLERK